MDFNFLSLYEATGCKYDISLLTPWREERDKHSGKENTVGWAQAKSC